MRNSLFKFTVQPRTLCISITSATAFGASKPQSNHGRISLPYNSITRVTKVSVLGMAVTIELLNRVIPGGSRPMISFQDIDAFTNSTLNVSAVDTSIAFPYDNDIQGDEWLTALESADAERSVAFFGRSTAKHRIYVSLTQRLCQTKNWNTT